MYNFYSDTINSNINRPVIKTVLLSLIIIFLFTASGCGRKVPPTLPQQLKPPVVRGLKANISGSTLTLNWPIPEGDGNNAEVTLFKVYRSKTSLDDPDCTDCPLVFQTVSEITNLNKNFNIEADRYYYLESLEPGFQYVYKVVPFSGKIPGKDSNLVEFDFKTP
ncbi:MAG: fibronectin type III domain-containing protein [Desulfobacterales bacterium]|nr:fibronectin type III domain-containing protein [Desulfobacterales bacterium]